MSGRFQRCDELVDLIDKATCAASRRDSCGSFAGEHTVRVIRELGYTGEQIAELYSRGVIHWEDVERLPAAR